MSYHSIPPQETFFYKGKWNEASVNALINLLIDAKSEGCWEVGGENESSLLTSLELLNVMISKIFTLGDVIDQHNMLKQRYLTFKAMLEVDGVVWDRVVNHVYATSSVWIELTKANPFAKAFYHKGDIMHDKLKALFGYEHDLTEACLNSVLAPIIIVDSDDEHEVDSPVVGVRKRLFHEPDDKSSHALVSAESHTVIVPRWPKQGVIKRPIFAPTKTGPPGGTSTSNVLLIPKKESSSCASSSPLKLLSSPSEKK